jgi:hypothetical protein
MDNYEQKNGTGVVWKNDKYTKGGNHPYAKGIIKGLNGEDLDVALWIPKSDKIKGFNLTMKPYEKTYEKPQEEYTTSAPTEESDLPF